ncbi:MAG TPA: multidrug effflux MFS transporter [Thiobacillaceae bacterium]|nr:multidrug effflux MFS transporter [Thiobacillaceae bacterium]
MPGDSALRTDATSTHHPLLIAVVVAALSVLAPFTIDTYLPSFPAIAAELDASHAQMQQTMGLYLAAFAIVTLIYGPLSDRFGRRPVIVGALLLYVVGSVGAALASTIEGLLFWRVVQGLSAGAGVVVGRAMVRDAFSGHHAQRVLSHAMLMFAVAPAIAPMIGGMLQHAYDWRAVFWFLALLGACVFALVAWRAPETLPVAARRSIHPVKVGRAYAEALRHRRFMALVLAFALNFGGFFIYIAAAPTLLYEHLHLGLNDFWMQFVPMVAGLMLGSFATGRLAGRMTPERGIEISYGVMLVASLLNVAQAFWLPPAPVNVLAPLVLYAFAVSFSMPGLTVLALDCIPRNRGMAAAVQSFMQVGFNAVVAGLLVPLISHHVWSLALGMLGLLLAGLLVWTWQAR